MSTSVRKIEFTATKKKILQNIKRLSGGKSGYKNKVNLHVYGENNGKARGSLWRNDKASLSIEEAIRIADYFNTSVDYLIFGPDKEAENDKNVAPIDTAVRMLNEVLVETETPLRNDTKREIIELLREEMNEHEMRIKNKFIRIVSAMAKEQ